MPNGLENTTITHNKLEINQAIYDLVANEIIPETGINLDDFWNSFEGILEAFMPRNKALLAARDALQLKIDNWHKSHRDEPHDPIAYEQFLRDINYLAASVPDFKISTQNIDPEIAAIAGPQLVVPINNARFSLNATNARWGSLFDAYYGTDVIPQNGELKQGKEFNPKRGAKVIELATNFLDQVLPLTEGSHKDVSAYTLLGSENTTKQLQIYLQNGHIAELKYPQTFIGYQDDSNTCCLLFKNNNLHFEVQIDPLSPIGKTTLAGLKDIIMEAAITTIQDCEDSVTAVDAEDKTLVYRNWLGLMRGNLEVTVKKGGGTSIRRLNPDREYKSPQGVSFSLPARSLLLVRNVGHLMTTKAICYHANLQPGLEQTPEEIPEGILDGMITALAFLHDYHGNSPYKNSASNSMYIVKPKMHGAEEVKFTVDLFAAIEDALKLPKNTIKIGIMDEERRTSLNLRACINEARERLIFINTGFLDRTGDEIHTSMEAGAFLNKHQLGQQPWIESYEDRNIDVGIQCGLPGKAQIGKGMWAMPDLMADMLKNKIKHPLSGASCAWVPSPTAATLHATHYHHVDVRRVQSELAHRPMASLEKLLTIPLVNCDKTPGDIQDCVDNNTQSILGYVVRWIDQGVGCSKVPDTYDVELMEDRATLRISSQLLANWLYHELIDENLLIESFKKMAKVVDKQNEKDPLYKPMAVDYSGVAFQAAIDLVLKGREQPNGYTEPLLHAYRIKQKMIQN